MTTTTVFIIAVVLTLLACEEPTGIYITDSCSDYADVITAVVEDFNEMEGYDVIVIEGNSPSTPGIKQKDVNDGTDYFYCIEGEGRGGTTNIGWGDIYLYVDGITGEILECILLHEFGHRYLRLRHSADADSRMYPGLTVGCVDKTYWTEKGE